MKLSRFLLDLLENNASLIINVVFVDNIIFTLPEPSIKSAGHDIVLTLASTNVNYEFLIFKNCVR